jgi:peptide/nickel transport system permease protein
VKRYVAVRLFVCVPTLLVVSVLCFALTHLVPGNVVQISAGEQALSPEQQAERLARLGLDRPLPLQYIAWLGRVARGDFGRSYANGLPVLGQIADRLPVNLELILLALAFTGGAGLLFGSLAAAFRNTWLDYTIRVFAVLGYCIPNFWLATMVVLAASLYFRWLPVLDYVPFTRDPWGNLQAMVVPGFVLGLAALSYVVRMTRASFLDHLRQDYVRTARAKGVAETVVLWRHVTKNALIPVVTVMGLQIGGMIGAFVLTEEVFVLPGLGRLLLDALLQRDLVVVQAIVLLLATVYLLSSLLVDILYAWLDPRIRYQ